MNYQLIEQNHKVFSVEKMCHFLKVSKGGYFSWRKRKPSQRKIHDEHLKSLILNIFQEHKARRGSPFIFQELKGMGYKISKKRVVRLMQELNIRAGFVKNYRPKTTDSKHNLAISPNILKQNFKTSHLNEVWVSDITYISIKNYFLYLCIIMDIHSRKIIGWSLADHMKTSMVSEALEMAVKRQKPPANVIFHSDQGSQYASHEFRGKLKSHGFLQSMSRKGNCYDNAVAESFFHTFKNEEINRHKYENNSEVRRSVFEYIEIYYNRIRKHTSLMYKTPLEFEELANAIKFAGK